MKKLLLKINLILFFVIMSTSFSVAQTPATGLNFDGNNDYVDLGNIPATNFGTGDFTIELWVKTSTYPSVEMSFISKRFVCGFDNFWNFVIQPDGKFYFEADDPAIGLLKIPSYNPIVDGAWHHIAYTREGIIRTLYLDGIVEIGGTAPILDLSNTYSVYLGRNACSDDPWGQYFDGSMDELRIWDYARSQQELIDNYHSVLAGNEPGLVSYYTFNQGYVGENNSGENILNDQSLGGNNGFLQNFSLNGLTSNWSEGNPDIMAPPPQCPYFQWWNFHRFNPYGFDNSNQGVQSILDTAELVQ